jgi:predicted enzyme related to lactoylglutathione lyase
VWHELLVNAADQKATVKFYQDLFGWDVEESKGYVSPFPYPLSS